MSVSYIPESTKCRLWGKSAGRCQYDACCEPLWRDSVTQFEFNTSYIAHIIADKPEGPRGHPVLSEQLKADLSNLMLLCDEHHRLVDKVDVMGHPVERLNRMKIEHEQRMELLTGIQPERQTEILLYGANIGVHSSPVSFEKGAAAVIPVRYPMNGHGIALGMSNSEIRDHDREYWQTEAMHLKRRFLEQVKPRLQDGTVRHLSVFAIAPQPLLMLLGFLLSDIPAAEIFQLHREPPDWKWQDHPEGEPYEVVDPDSAVGRDPALVLSLSATIDPSRVFAVLGDETPIWSVTVPQPNNDFLKSQQQLRDFRVAIRRLMDRIKATHGEEATVHIFPAVPVAAAVELGRIIMPKADLPIRIYDQNRTLGGFSMALEINSRD
jgi:hypothetical protein